MTYKVTSDLATALLWRCFKPCLPLTHGSLTAVAFLLLRHTNPSPAFRHFHSPFANPIPSFPHSHLIPILPVSVETLPSDQKVSGPFLIIPSQGTSPHYSLITLPSFAFNKLWISYLLCHWLDYICSPFATELQALWAGTLPVSLISIMPIAQLVLCNYLLSKLAN